MIRVNLVRKHGGIKSEVQRPQTTVCENKTNRERQDRTSTAWRSRFPVLIEDPRLVQCRVSFENKAAMPPGSAAYFTCALCAST